MDTMKSNLDKLREGLNPYVRETATLDKTCEAILKDVWDRLNSFKWNYSDKGKTDNEQIWMDVERFQEGIKQLLKGRDNGKK